MSRSRPVEGPTISLFPFLAVLLCTMGALLVVLVLFSRSAKTTAEAAVAAVDPELELAKENAVWRLGQLEGVRARTTEDLSKARLQLAGTEEHNRELADELARLEKTLADLDSGKSEKTTADEIRDLEARLKSTRESLDKARAELASRPPAYAVVPYVGQHGTHRRPLYIECCVDGVFLQPEGIRLNPTDFDGPPGPGNPLACALRAAREHIARTTGGSGDPAAQPYPLLLVRPSGVMAYYAAREAIQSWGSEFGYQLVDEDWTLSFPPRDPTLAEVEKRAIDESRQRLQWLAESRPARPVKPAQQYRAATTRGGVVAEGGPSVLGDQSRFEWANQQAASFGQGGGGGQIGGSGAGGSSGPGGGVGGLPGGVAHGPGGGSGGSPGGTGATGPGRPFSAAAGTGDGMGAGDDQGDAVLGDGSGGGGPGSGGTPGMLVGRSDGKGGQGGSAAGGGQAGSGGRYGSGGSQGESQGRASADGAGSPGAGAESQLGSTASAGGEASAGATGGGAMGSAGTAGGATASAGGGSGSGSLSSAQGGGAGGGIPMPGLLGASGSAGGASGASGSVSMSNSRGKNWASLATSERPIPLTRPILIECTFDEFRILDDSGRRVQARVAIPSDTAEAIDPLVKEIHARVAGWGLAGDRMYWKPKLVLSATADGRSRREDLERLLADSGIETKPRGGEDEIRNLPPVQRASYLTAPRTRDEESR